MKLTLQLLLATFFIGVANAEFRTWTRLDGKTAELDLVGVSESAGVKSGEFKMRSGSSITLAATILAEADAKLVNEWVAKPVSAEPETAASEGTPSVFDEILEGNLQILDGRKLKPYKLTAKPTKHYVFYYTASWCGPCQAYTPELVDFYKRAKKESENSFELVLISSDREVEAMEEYAKDKKMPWPQLEFSKVKEFRSKFSHNVKGIPSVIICDLEGKIVSRTEEIGEIKKILK